MSETQSYKTVTFTSDEWNVLELAFASRRITLTQKVANSSGMTQQEWETRLAEHAVLQERLGV